MRKVLTISKREYAEVAKTKMFWFSALLPAVLFAVLILFGTRELRQPDRLHTTMPAQEAVSPEQEAVPQQQPQGAGVRGSPDRPQQLMSAFFVLFLMFLTIVTTSQALLSSLIEERNSRVLEVLLSAVSPFQLMAGKILGLTAIGLTLAAVFAGTVLTAAASRGLLHGVRLAGMCYFLPYYLLGFLLIASVYAAVGAACNTLKEAQAMMLPVMLVFILPMMGWMSLARNPNGWPAIALSLFPPTTPMVMMLRIATAPAVPAVQIALSLVLLAASAVFVTWLSAKIFRTGILMYGKPPRLREMLRWARQS